MPHRGSIGRDLESRREDGVTVALAGIRNNGVEIDNEPVDFTTNDDDGFRRLSIESAERQINLSIEGLVLDEEWAMDSANGTNLVKSLVIVRPTGSTISGDFRLNNYNEGAPYKEAFTFTATLQSTGPFVWSSAS
jgi:predicted secreted protein